MEPKKPNAYQILIVILSLAVVALVFTAFQKKVGKPQVLPPEQTPGTTTAVEWPSTEIRKETIDQSDGKRKITASYPITKSESVNAYFKQYADSQIKQFKDDTSWVDDPSVTSASEDTLSLDIDYTHAKSTHADNYIFTESAYTGGAHGLTVTKTFVFSQEGKLVTPSDLFSNGLNGLKTIATYAQAELAKRDYADKQWISEGAAPTEDNYRNIIVTDTGISVIFDPYQVAAYAAGSQTVDIPLKVFKGVANKQYFTQ